MHAIRCSLLSLVAATALCAPATSAILRVKSDAPGPTHNGTTWATAYLKVSNATSASLPGDEIWVAAGTYNEPTTLNAGRSLLGGFAGTETLVDQRNPAVNVTILDGYNKGDAVVTITTKDQETATVDGFTLQNGYGHPWSVSGGPSYYTDLHSGGGVYVYGGAPIISNNRIVNNNCSFDSGPFCDTHVCYMAYGEYGGGICIANGTAIVSHNTISGNKAKDGAAIYVGGGSPTIDSNTFSDNTATEAYVSTIFLGGANPILINNTISGNTASGVHVECETGTISDNVINANAMVGVGLYSGTLHLLRNTITANAGGGVAVLGGTMNATDNVIRSNTHGGGVYQSGGSLSLLRNTIASNSADLSGGGVRCDSNATIADNVIAGNSATLQGGGIAIDRTKVSASAIAVSVLNNTLAGNTAANGGGGLAVVTTNTTSDTGAVLINNIVAFNASGVLVGTNLTPTFSHNCVFGNTAYDFQGITSPIGTNGNVAYDPSFKDPDNGNYRLSPGSSCIDAGDNSAVTTGDTDLDGNPRVIGAHVDIGCYETASSTGRASAIRALKIAAGLAAIQPGDLISLDVVAGDSASKVDMRDAVALLRAANGLG